MMMTLFTRDHEKAGTIDYLAILVGEDPDHDYCRINIESKRFKTRDGAQRWAARQMKTDERALSTDIYEYRWEENTFWWDEESDTVFDADEIEVSSQYGYVTTDNCVEWDPIWISR